MSASSPNPASIDAASASGPLAIRSLSVEARLDPAALPCDVLPPPGRPAGEVFWHVRLGARQLPVRLSGKTYRRVLRDAQASTIPVVAVFQASLQPSSTAHGLCLEHSGLRLDPKGAGGSTSPICQSCGVRQPATVALPWLEASVSLAMSDLPVARSGRFQLSLGATVIAVQLAEGASWPSSGAERVLVLRGRLTASATGFELADGKFTARVDAAPSVTAAQRLAPAAAAAPEPVRAPAPPPEPVTAAEAPTPGLQAPALVEPAAPVPDQIPLSPVAAPAQPAASQAGPPVRASKRLLIPGAEPAPSPEPAAVAVPRVRRVRAQPARAAPAAPAAPQRRPEPSHAPLRKPRARSLAPGEYDFEAAIEEIVREEVGRAVRPFLREVEALAERLGLGRPVSNTSSARKRRRGER